MTIHKISPSVDYNSLLKSLDTLLDEPTYINLTEVPKVKPTNKKILLCLKLFYSAVCLILSLQRSLSSEIAACCKKLIPQR